ncbi:hypothetical protein ACQKMV_03725 [Lysinibacillus sp. NPDC094403]|uniref:hypothetical protein n=1 Tax=Lysinibacillus sp. NPDC094403 TaxID=3390581 RepID=UPI003CFF904D
MKKIELVVLAFLLLYFSIQHVKAGPYDDDVVSNFLIAMANKEEEQLKTYVSSNVKIPEIREETPISGFSGLPSPKENDRVAFIWEITFNQEKVTDIRVVYDGSNPFMNESKIIKEYMNKHIVNILTVSQFPFDITHVEGSINNDILLIRYQNVNSHGLLQVRVEPDEENLKAAEGENIYTLKNGIRALYQPNVNQLIFVHDSLKYSISIESEITENFTVQDLLEIANSMF